MSDDNIFGDMFGDIFGTSADDILKGKFNAFAEGLKDKKKLDKKEEIKTEIKKTIQSKNKEALEITLKIYTHEVMLTKDNELFEIFALGNIYIENQLEAINSLKCIFPKKNPVQEAIGIIYHQMDEFSRALESFNGITFTLPSTRIAKSQSTYFTGNKNYTDHLKMLFRLTESSAEANSILGTLSFNDKDYDRAKTHFMKALELKPGTPYILFNFLKTEYKKDKNKTFQHLGEFIHETQNVSSPEELILELEKDIIKMKRYKPRNVYSAVENLL